MSRAEEAFACGDCMAVFRLTDEAMACPGYESNLRALRLRARAGKGMTRRGLRAIIPLPEEAPPIKDVPIKDVPYAGEPDAKQNGLLPWKDEDRNEYEDGRPSWELIRQELEKELQENWKMTARYSTFRFYVGAGTDTEDGRYRLLPTLVVEDDESPALYDIETTHYHGAVVADARTGCILYRYLEFYFHDAGTDVSFSYYNYDTILHSTADGLWLLIHGDGLLLRRAGCHRVIRIADGQFKEAVFLADDRFVLARRIDGTVVVYDLTGGLGLREAFPDEDDDPPASGEWERIIPPASVKVKNAETFTYTFAGKDYGSIRRIDDNSFAITRGDFQQLCWLDWEYE